ncbi:MAG: hypothetical protein LBT59_09065 [Clostridiales bacterium]|nr:hypothetical protein [Clostridiales bacterium]
MEIKQGQATRKSNLEPTKSLAAGKSRLEIRQNLARLKNLASKTFKHRLKVPERPRKAKIDKIEKK